uniref:RZ-type domain-containing protein n=1 Tax=Esox lucius TaxID=8010 RepID=A0AAY5KHR1_ESOLU
MDKLFRGMPERGSRGGANPLAHRRGADGGQRVVEGGGERGGVSGSDPRKDRKIRGDGAGGGSRGAGEGGRGSGERGGGRGAREGGRGSGERGGGRGGRERAGDKEVNGLGGRHRGERGEEGGGVSGEGGRRGRRRGGGGGGGDREGGRRREDSGAGGERERGGGRGESGGGGGRERGGESGGGGGRERERGGGGGERGGGGGWRREERGGGRRGAGRGGRGISADAGAPRANPIGFKALEELSAKDPSEIAITLASSYGLKALLEEKEIRTDLVQLLCQVLCKAFLSKSDRRTLQHLADYIKNSGFLRSILPLHVMGMGSDHNVTRREQYPKHLDNIITLLTEVLSIFPASSVQVVSMIVALFRPVITSLRAVGVNILVHTEENLDSIQALVDQLQEKAREGTLKSDSYSFITPEGDAPPGEADFRTLSIYPTPEDFHQFEKPFLRPNLTSHRYGSAMLYLDTHFRLMREDFVRPLREGIQELLHSLQDTDNKVQLKMRRFDDIRVYFDTRIGVPVCTSSGLTYKVHFDSKPLKSIRWENSKRLIYGSLVCMSCDNFVTCLFATVSDRDPKELKKGFVQLHLSAESRRALAGLETRQPFLMVETTAYFEAYRYVLEGLQELEVEDLPFLRYIVECSADVHPPAYLHRADSYNLSAIARPKFMKSIHPFRALDPAAWPPREQLGLDESQMRALQLALTKELAIIQGPPGTGKTYTGLKIAEALLTNQELWSDDLGPSPMLVVCYTNHALDQFLEGIHGFLPNGIVRVGGRSSSEVLKRFTLRELKMSKKTQLPKHLRRANEESKIQDHWAQMECSLQGVLREKLLKTFMSERHWESLMFNSVIEVIRKVQPISMCVCPQMQRKQKKKMKRHISRELGKSSAMTEVEEDTTLNVWTLSQPDRWRLYRLWVGRFRADLVLRAQEAEQRYQDTSDRLAEIRVREDICVLQGAKVIGMTTTGAARCRKVLQEVRPRLVIVEEAAEVLEAHTITTLSQACQHLILIGDHQQLRPSATVYDLARNFNLEVSMFERLVKMDFPYVKLNYQHRMRPDIARLLVPHIYTELENHPSVMEYDNIKGLQSNMFFVDHNHYEKHINDSKSHQNLHEAQFVVALCRYLLLQEYNPSQITILTTYTGQLYCLRDLMPAKEFKGVKVHVVDKYQGEENDIVLLSLVRSNKEGKVGFLSIPNRVCVALSRAKMGLYCIGNMAMLGKVKPWTDILQTLREKDQVGKALTLCCQNHPERLTKASCAEDFKNAPEGGCNLLCEFRLDCGHVCTRVCHPYDQEHKKYNCIKKCPKILCELGHPCPKQCYQECPPICRQRLVKIVPQCQHKQMVPCHQDPETFVCQEPCEKKLTCGHQCASVCGESCTTACMETVTLKLKCGHQQQCPCHYKTSMTLPECTATCRQTLKCGHPCPGSCRRCHQGRFHVACSHRCSRLLVCSHECQEPCTRECPPCPMPCRNRCVHSACMRPCGQPCVPCIEPCAWQCAHLRCSKLCHEPCDRLPCTQPCNKRLPCGHLCIGLCGDTCPDECRVCHPDEVGEIFFGTEDDADACFIQLEDCGHFFESTAMDRYMGNDYTQQDAREEIAIKLKECPRCRTPIRRNLRYGVHVNQSLAEIEKVKEKINGLQSDIEGQKSILKQQWSDNKDLKHFLLTEYLVITEKLNASHLTAKELWVIENQMLFLEKLHKLKSSVGNLSSLEDFDFEEKVEEFLLWLMDHNQKFSEQQASDLQNELRRLSFLAELNIRCKNAGNKASDVKVLAEVTAIRTILNRMAPFSQLDESLVKQALKDLDQKLPKTGLGITDEERQMIVSAMMLPKGHWYKCPNNHVYAIGECGGAMESRSCPECKATIGGANHALVSGNTVASEMDGAQHAAWSEANNVLNFDLRNLAD